MPLEKKLPIGTNEILYSGQTLRFTTAVPLFVRLEPISAVEIRFTIRVLPGAPIPQGPEGNAQTTIHIFWVNFGADVYDGGPPSGVIEGVLNTEGGFVDR
jgi:hypothetical protein